MFDFLMYKGVSFACVSFTHMIINFVCCLVSAMASRGPTTLTEAKARGRTPSAESKSEEQTKSILGDNISNAFARLVTQTNWYRGLVCIPREHCSSHTGSD